MSYAQKQPKNHVFESEAAKNLNFQFKIPL